MLPLAELLGSDSGDGSFDGGKLAMSTDSYVVNPIVFPGGSIGELAVNGTVNDLAVSGAIPKVISAGFILKRACRWRIYAAKCRRCARPPESAGVSIVTGDTKVVPKGSGDKLFINTAGIDCATFASTGSRPSSAW